MTNKKEVKHSTRSYSEDFKRQIIEYYLANEFTKQEVWKKFTGQYEEHGTLLRWMRKYGYTTKDKLSKYMKGEKDELEKLVEEERIKVLEQRLRDAELKAIAYSKMIDMAEKKFNISIRKKFDTKPSRR